MEIVNNLMFVPINVKFTIDDNILKEKLIESINTFGRINNINIVYPDTVPLIIENDNLYFLILKNYILLSCSHRFYDGTSIQIINSEISKIYHGIEVTPLVKINPIPIIPYEPNYSFFVEIPIFRVKNFNNISLQDLTQCLNERTKKNIYVVVNIRRNLGLKPNTLGNIIFHMKVEKGDIIKDRLKSLSSENMSCDFRNAIDIINNNCININCLDGILSKGLILRTVIENRLSSDNLLFLYNGNVIATMKIIKELNLEYHSL